MKVVVLEPALCNSNIFDGRLQSKSVAPAMLWLRAAHCVAREFQAPQPASRRLCVSKPSEEAAGGAGGAGAGTAD